MALRDYLVTEIALDHAEGHLTRRDALHRLGLLGLSAAAASGRARRLRQRAAAGAGAATGGAPAAASVSRERGPVRPPATTWPPRWPAPRR